jgi:putative ABC transport system permease protein
MRTAIAVALLGALAAAGVAAAGTGQTRSIVVAVGRAVVQLAAVGLVIAVIFRTPALTPVYLTSMLAVAAWTSGRRLGGELATLLSCALAIGASAALAAGIVLASGALPLTARTAVPFTAQLIGGAMTATTLAGQRLRDDVAARWELVEGWLALGARPAQAVRPMARTAAARSLVPAIDQTRNVGLVVLPGAYVGLLLAGASPLQAGTVQLLVLVGLLGAESVAAALITRLLATRWGTRRPAVT